MENKRALSEPVLYRKIVPFINATATLSPKLKEHTPNNNCIHNSGPLCSFWIVCQSHKVLEKTWTSFLGKRQSENIFESFSNWRRVILSSYNIVDEGSFDLLSDQDLRSCGNHRLWVLQYELKLCSICGYLQTPASFDMSLWVVSRYEGEFQILSADIVSISKMESLIFLDTKLLRWKFFFETSFPNWW